MNDAERNEVATAILDLKKTTTGYNYFVKKGTTPGPSTAWGKGLSRLENLLNQDPPPPPPPPPSNAYFVSDWSTGDMRWKPWATVFDQTGGNSVGYERGSSPKISSSDGHVAVVKNPYGTGNVLRCEIKNTDTARPAGFWKSEIGSAPGADTITFAGGWPGAATGRELYIDMELYWSDEFRLTNGMNLMDLHPSSNSGVPGLGLGGYTTDRLQLHAGTPGYLQRKDYIPLTSANRNRKLHLLIGARIALDGWVEAYLDGKLVIPRFSVRTAEADERGPYFKQGLYRWSGSSPYPNGGSVCYFGATRLYAEKP